MRKHRPDRCRLVLAIGLIPVALCVGVGIMAEHGIVPIAYYFVCFVGVQISMVLIAWLVAAQLRYDRQHAYRVLARRRRREAQQHTAERQPARFDDRLANYLQHSGEDGAHPDTEPEPRYRSKMPFWCRADVFTRIGPKSRRRIRELLDRIHRAVRGRQNGHG